MIHDLTANNDFHSEGFGLLGRWNSILENARDNDELTPLYEEIDR